MRAGVRGGFLGAFRAVALGLSLGVSVWGLSQAPFAAPLVDRTAAATARVLEREVARMVTPEWLAGRLDAALAAGDRDRAEMLAQLAADRGLQLSAAQQASLDALRAATTGFLAEAGACGRCALDVTACDSIALLGVCGIPLELSPVGDMNALRRAAVAGLSGDPVDELEVALALVGLGATGLVVATGGASATLKAGATGLRLARRLDVLTPGFARSLGSMADLPVNWDRAGPYLLGAATLDEVTDTARLARLGAVAADLGAVARNTSPADALMLLRHVDSPADAARLARLSASAGPDTGRVIEVLGKGRAFRALVRLSDIALATLAALYALAVQVLVLMASAAGNALLRQVAAVAKRGPAGP